MEERFGDNGIKPIGRLYAKYTDSGTLITKKNDRGVKVGGLRDKTPEQKMKFLIYRKDNHSFVVSEIGKRFTPNNAANKLHRRAARAEQERMSTMIAPNNQWRHLDDSLVAPTTLGDIKNYTEATAAICQRPHYPCRKCLHQIQL